MKLTRKQNFNTEPRDSVGPFFNLTLRLFIRENIGQISLIVFLIILVYYSSLPNGVVSDDNPLMVSSNLKNPLPILKSEPVNALINSLTYTLNFFLHGRQPFGYHFVNVLLHLAVTLAVFFFLSLLLNSRIAFLAALLFGVAPLHAEAVSWISGRHYPLYTLFSLLALIFYVLNDRFKTAKSHYYLSLIFFVLAVYSFPEMAIIFPLLLPLVDLYREKLSKKIKLYLPFFALAGLFTLLSLTRVQQRIDEISTIPQLLGEAPINYFLSVIISLSTYLKLFLLPFGLSFYHENLTFSTPTLLLMGILVAVLLIVPIIFYKKNRGLMLGVGIFVVTLLPTLTPFKISWIVAERYAYFGSLGLALLLAYLFNYLTERTNFRSLAKYALVGLIIIYSLLTFLRGFDWKDEDSLWLATVKASPTSSKAWNNMGDYHGRHGDMQKSFEAFVKATQLNPSYSDAWHNAGNVLLQAGQADEAIPYFEKSLEFNPSLIEAYNNLALSYHKKGDEKKVDELLQKSLQINPQSLKTYNLLAAIEFDRRHFNAAREALLKAVSLDPQNQLLRQNLSILEKQKQQWEATTSQTVN